MIKDMADDEAIQATNDDASECKRYAVQLGYWCDPFISLFVKQTARKAPEINRGYYARVKGIELFVDKFLKVSVGATRQGSFLPCPFPSLFPPFPPPRFATRRARCRSNAALQKKSLVPLGCTFCTRRVSSRLSSRRTPTPRLVRFGRGTACAPCPSTYIRSAPVRKKCRGSLSAEGAGVQLRRTDPLAAGIT